MIGGKVEFSYGQWNTWDGNALINLANSQTTTEAYTVAGLWAFGSANQPCTHGGTIGVRF